MDISDIRRLTPAVDNCAYFQTSGFSPKPEPVTEEVVRWIHFQNQGPALSWVHAEMDKILESTRGKVAQALSASADEIMLNENTTVGINLVAYGIDWRPGDNVLLSSHEHPGNRIPWYHMTQRYGIELRFLTIGNDFDQMCEEFDSLLDKRTRLVSISHVSRRTGVRLPARDLVRIAHDHGVPVLLDGAQAFGAIPVDVRSLDCDFYTCSGHKYIMAPQGTGAFYIRRDMLDWLQPSWIGSHSQIEFDLVGKLVLKDSARRFEFGTRDIADQAGFGKALEMWEDIGWQKVYDHISAYTDYLKQELLTVPGLQLETPMSYDDSSGIVTFHIEGLESAPMCASLMEHEHVLVGGLEHDTHSIRVSTHVFNTREEADRLVSGLMRIVRSGY